MKLLKEDKVYFGLGFEGRDHHDNGRGSGYNGRSVRLLAYLLMDQKTG